LDFTPVTGVELHKAGTRFVVLGGDAVAFRGHPRATEDLDVLVEADPDNAKRVYAALAAFGAPLSVFEVNAEDFASYDGVLQLGVPPRRIDIINRTDGITFAEAETSDGDDQRLEQRDDERVMAPAIGMRAKVSGPLGGGTYLGAIMRAKNGTSQTSVVLAKSSSPVS
jgi:hypothetical protein